MPLPTLGRLGALKDPKGDPKRDEELGKIIPIDYIANWISERMQKTGIENRFLVLKAETASGKSTYLLSELMRRFIFNKTAQSIICTQPRILTAIRNVLEIIKYNKDIKLGDNIGYSAGGQRVRIKKPGLHSVTVGTLMAQLKSSQDDEIINAYRFIIIDETHERDLSIDMTLYMLKNFLLRNQANLRCPFVICMSATFDWQPFVNYFKGTIDNFIWVRGDSYKIDEQWDWNNGRIVNNYAQAAAQCVHSIIKAAPEEDPLRADVLIFMPGSEHIKNTTDWLHKLNKELVAEKFLPMSIIKIDSEAQKTQNIDYKRLDIPVANQRVVIDGNEYVPGRRVIISTNVAETGLTLENLKYVIDAGFNKEIEFNPNFSIRALIVKPAPRSRIIQRRGRAGRNFPGVFIPLYPKYIYDKLPVQQLPQILLEDVSQIALDIVYEQLRTKLRAGEQPLFDIPSIDMIDPPSADNMLLMMTKLYTLGFVSNNAPDFRELAYVSKSIYLPNVGGYSLTVLGNLSRIFTGVPVEGIRMILSSFFWDCSTLDTITMAAYLTLDFDSFSTRIDGVKVEIGWNEVYKLGFSDVKIDYDKLRLIMTDDFINGIILINSVKSTTYNNVGPTVISALRDWCARTKTNFDGILALVELRDNIIEQALKAGIDVFANEKKSLKGVTNDTLVDTITKLKYCIYDGYRNNILLLKGSQYYTAKGNVPILTPASLQVNPQARYKYENYPEILLYDSLDLKLNRKDPTGVYNVRAKRISSMAGFVNTDMQFSS